MRDTILVADGLDTERIEIVNILKSKTKIIEALDGEEAITIIEKKLDELEVVLLKLMIPKVDGLRILEIMNRKGWIKKVPVLIIDRPGSLVMEDKCFELGVADFIQKPFTDKSVLRRVQTAVLSSHSSDDQQDKVGQQDKLDQQIKLMQQKYQLCRRQMLELNNIKKNILGMLGTIAEFRNMNNKNHVVKVERITKILADEMLKTFPECGLSEKKNKLIAEASVLHDIGKITIPDSMLMKPGKMTGEEYEFMESHTTKGCEILERMKGVWDKDYADICNEICRSHHEKYDGKGYPDGLAGDDIPISAQLVSVADVYDALVNERVYKRAYPKEKAYNMIVSGECGMFNPKIIDCFIRTREKIESLYSDVDESNTLEI